jgi:hypothetical protein
LHFSSEANKTAAEPSDICEAFAAEITPSFLKTGFNSDSFFKSTGYLIYFKMILLLHLDQKFYHLL